MYTENNFYNWIDSKSQYYNETFLEILRYISLVYVLPITINILSCLHIMGYHVCDVPKDDYLHQSLNFTWPCKGLNIFWLAHLGINTSHKHLFPLYNQRFQLFLIYQGLYRIQHKEYISSNNSIQFRIIHTCKLFFNSPPNKSLW